MGWFPPLPFSSCNISLPSLSHFPLPSLAPCSLSLLFPCPGFLLTSVLQWIPEFCLLSAACMQNNPCRWYSTNCLPCSLCSVMSTPLTQKNTFATIQKSSSNCRCYALPTHRFVHFCFVVWFGFFFFLNQAQYADTLFKWILSSVGGTSERR